MGGWGHERALARAFQLERMEYIVTLIQSYIALCQLFMLKLKVLDILDEMCQNVSGMIMMNGVYLLVMFHRSAFTWWSDTLVTIIFICRVQIRA